VPIAVTEPKAPLDKRALVLLKYQPVCICNTIRYPCVKRAIDGGARSVREVAEATGCTTGSCLGERCTPVIREMLRAAGHPVAPDETAWTIPGDPPKSG
jgi:bacterioferritin-associated ferredoxin